MKEQGFVLVQALLFMFLLTLLVLESVEQVLLQYQLQQVAQLQQQLFFLAEHGLHEGEKSLQDFSEQGLSVKVTRLSITDKSDTEQLIDYDVTSIATQQNQKVCLQSIIQITKTTALRKSWLQLNGDKQC